jgi:protein tyrosine/serine phosphatase
MRGGLSPTSCSLANTPDTQTRLGPRPRSASSWTLAYGPSSISPLRRTDWLPTSRHLSSVAARRDLDLHRLEFPIADLDVVNDDAYVEITDAVGQSLGRGGAYVHCWGGVGRTGTVIGCLLADQGLTHDQVLERLVALRKGTRKAARPIPETKAQRDVIRRRAAMPSPRQVRVDRG